MSLVGASLRATPDSLTRHTNSFNLARNSHKAWAEDCHSRTHYMSPAHKVSYHAHEMPERPTIRDSASSSVRHRASYHDDKSYSKHAFESCCHPGVPDCLSVRDSCALVGLRTALQQVAIRVGWCPMMELTEGSQKGGRHCRVDDGSGWMGL